MVYLLRRARADEVQPMPVDGIRLHEGGGGVGGG